MPIDAERLMRFPIPAVRQQLTQRDAAFYALSIGLGHDPLDRVQLPFVDPLAGPVAVPSMALVLAHPGFWLGHPESGVDPVAVLHGGQSLTLLAPVPVDGEVASSTRITGLVDKGPGKAALIITQTELVDAAGVCFARLDRTTFIRDGGGFGGSDAASPPVLPPSPHPAPEGEPEVVIDLPTLPEQALFYRLNGDLNPLHSDPQMAARAGFDRPILHGLCTMGIVTHALLRRLDYRAEQLQSVSLRFAAPVMPGETIRTEIWANGAFRARVAERGTVIADQGYFTTSDIDRRAI